MKKIISIFNRLTSKIKHQLYLHVNGKYKAELDFWKKTLILYEKWYKGELKELYKEPSPNNQQKIKAYSVKDSAILTWEKLHQQKKYLEDLLLDKLAFKGLKVLDIGSGPHPSAVVFENCKVYCLDPLLPFYIEIGFPLHYYDRVKFVYGFSENIPFVDNFFDAIISVNAMDHVDDFYKTAKEIKRVLKPKGKIRMHIHYHQKTKTEPLEINDEIVKKAFKWSKNLYKIKESKSKRGHALKNKNEVYTLWSNF